jgi:hypothetical protein
MLRVWRAAALTALLIPLTAQAALIAPGFSGIYTITNIGRPPGLPGTGGGLTFEAGNNNVLLIGGNAEFPSGQIYAVDVTRDPVTHSITGYSSAPASFASAPDDDGGLTYGPGGDLFFTQYTDNTIGQIKPGNSSPNKTSLLPGVIASTGGLTFIPAGFNGAGNAAITSFNGFGVCSAPVTPDGAGTYNFGICTDTVSLGTPLEGIEYVPLGTPGFSSPTVLVALYSLAKIEAYQLDANGMPIPASGVDFATIIGSAQGIGIDPVTGDFLFDEYSAGSPGLFVVHANVQAAPEPGTWLLLLLGAAAAAPRALARRRIAK